MAQAPKDKTHLPLGMDNPDDRLTPDSARLVRYNLGGISVEDLMKVTSDPAGEGAARKEYVARIHTLLPLLRGEINRAAALELDFSGRWAENWMQVIFSRGGVNHGATLLERWEALSAEHLSNIKEAQSKDKPFDKFNPAPETES